MYLDKIGEPVSLSQSTPIAIRRSWTFGLLLCFVVCSAAMFARHLITLVRHLGLHKGLGEYVAQSSYNRTVLALNYFDDGFVRRGLGGTVTALLSEHWPTSTILFIGLSLVWLLAPMTILATMLSYRLRPAALCYILGLAAASPQLFLGWGFDPARTDMFAAGFVAWSVVATLSGYRVVGGVLVLVGLLVHETALIFGAPLLLVMNWHDFRQGTISRGEAIRALLAFCGGLACIFVLQAHLSEPQAVLAANMLRVTPQFLYDPVHRLWRDIAIYMAVTGPRSLQTALCHNYSFNRQYPIVVFFCLATLAIYGLILPIRGKPAVIAVAMMLPVVFMLLVANDTGRWLRLGVLNGWLITVFFLLRGELQERLTDRWIGIGTMTVLALLYLGYTSYNQVNATTHRWSLRLGFPDPAGLQEWMDTCDPGWVRYVYGREQQSSPP